MTSPYTISWLNSAAIPEKNATSVTSGDVTWGMSVTSTQDTWDKNNRGIKAKITNISFNTDEIPGEITKITINIGRNSSSYLSSLSMTCKVNNVVYGTANTHLSGKNNADYEFTPSTAQSGTIDISIDNTQEGDQLYIGSIKVEFQDAPVAKDYTITKSDHANGDFTISPSSADEGDVITLSANPNDGFMFNSWKIHRTGYVEQTIEPESNTANTTFTMPAFDVTVKAYFAAIPFVITHTAAEHGTYTIQVAAEEPVSENTVGYIGQTVTLVATPDDGYALSAWNVKDADNNDVTVTNNQFTMPAKAVTISPVFSNPAVLNTLFSMTNITGITNSTDNNKIGSVTATISDGSTVEVYNNGGNASSMLYNNSINLNGSGSNYVHITLPTKLVKGDVITATFLSDGQKWKIGTTSNKNNASSKTNPYELVDNDAFIGATDLYFFKDNAAQIRAITIKGVGQVSDLAVTSSTTPTFAIGATSDITISSSSTGAVTYTSSDESVAKVSSTGVITGVGGGTTTITVNQDADETYRAGYATINVTVLEPALIKVKLNGGTSATVTGAIGGTADVNVQSDKKFGSSSYAGFTLANSETLHTGDVINVKITQASSSGSGTIAIYDSDKSTVLYDTGVKGVVGDNKFVLPAAVDGKGTIYICRTSANGWNAYVDYIAVYRPDAVVTLNASGFATFSNAEDFEFAGADAYKMLLTTTSLAGTKVETAIPAGEGILFKGTAGDLVAIMNTTGAPAITGNSLHATTTATDNIVAMPSGKTIFVLDPTGDTFKKYTGTAFVANKAFFQIDGDNVESRILTMTFDDGSTTAISGIEEVAPATMKTRKVVKNGRLVIETANGEYTVSGARVK